MYNYNHLYYFYITVKSGGFTPAAKHLLISQPSLSGQLKVLEEFLQIKLFKKVGRKNELTEQGSTIFGFCTQMFEASEEMKESIDEKIPNESRRIHIGVSDEIANSFVVEVISHFLGKYSDKLRPKVTMTSAGHGKLEEQLRFREIDVVVTPFKVIDPDLQNLQNIEVPVNLICTIDKNCVLKKKTMDINSALKHLAKNGLNHWVMPSTGLKLRTEINQFFESSNIDGRVVFESDVMESLTKSVVDKIGVAFLPLIYVPKELENKTVHSLGPKAGYWKHRICLASHTNKIEDPLLMSLSHSFKDICNPLISR